MVSAPQAESISFYRASMGGVPEDFLLAGKGSDGDYCYYRQPNGWITVGSIGKRSAMLHAYQDRGWTPLLREYGQFDFPRPYYADNPFEVLFLRGGAREMPIEQIQALGYDRWPPKLPRCTLALGNEHAQPTKSPSHIARCWTNVSEVVFPQLAGHTPVPVPKCEFCDREDFTSAKGREQHMRVMHLQELREISSAREMAAGVRDALAKGAPSASPQWVTGTAAGLPAHPFACTLCSETFEKLRGPEGLEAHAKLHEGDDSAS